MTKESSVAAIIKQATRRRFSWVLRSASRRAEVAPTPNTIPAVVGAVMRARISGIRSLSATVHCLSRGSQAALINPLLELKNRASLKASARSFFQDF